MGGTAFSRAHAEFVARAPRCSVVVCTRERPDYLRRCLDSLTFQDHPDFGVWVIDNAPLSGNTREVVDSFGADLDIHYVVELRPGTSRARNAGLRMGDIVASLDDDEVADSLWLSELARAFDGRPEHRRGVRCCRPGRAEHLGAAVVRAVRRLQQRPRVYRGGVLPAHVE